MMDEIEYVDIEIKDCGKEQTDVIFKAKEPHADAAFRMPRHLVGRLSEQLVDHINKGGTR